MNVRHGLGAFWTLVIPAVLLQGACGTVEPQNPKFPELSQEPEEAPDDSWDVAEEGEASKAEPAPVEEPESPSSTRPALKLRHSSEIEASVDLTGADLRLGKKASLIFPTRSLADPVSYRFAQRRGIKGPKRIGLNYEFGPAVSSTGAPFVLELPLPKWAKKANFAVLHTGPRKAGQPRGWTVVASTRIDHDKGLAILETSELPEGWIYLTPKAPD